MGRIAALVLLLGSCGEPYQPPDSTLPSFVLPGPHAALSCEDCHGPPPFQAFVWDTTCLSCHEQDRKGYPTSTHYLGLACSDASGCHADTDATWADNDGVPHDFLPLEGVHQIECVNCHTEAVPTGDDIVPLGGNRYSCASCHDVVPEATGTGTTATVPGGQQDRPAGHFVETGVGLPAGADLAWDCNACHDSQQRKGLAIGGWTTTSDHGGIRFPHGTEVAGTPLPPAAWVVACTDCHVQGPAVSTAATCSVTCHGELFTYGDHHGSSQGGNDVSCTLAGCHPYADIREGGGTAEIGPLE